MDNYLILTWKVSFQTPISNWLEWMFTYKIDPVLILSTYKVCKHGERSVFYFYLQLAFFTDCNVRSDSNQHWAVLIGKRRKWEQLVLISWLIIWHAHWPVWCVCFAHLFRFPETSKLSRGAASPVALVSHVEGQTLAVVWMNDFVGTVFTGHFVVCGSNCGH